MPAVADSRHQACPSRALLKISWNPCLSRIDTMLHTRPHPDASATVSPGALSFSPFKSDRRVRRLTSTLSDPSTSSATIPHHDAKSTRSLTPACPLHKTCCTCSTPEPRSFHCSGKMCLVPARDRMSSIYQLRASDLSRRTSCISGWDRIEDEHIPLCPPGI
jgi:hypothetical protein